MYEGTRVPPRDRSAVRFGRKISFDGVSFLMKTPAAQALALLMKEPAAQAWALSQGRTGCDEDGEQVEVGRGAMTALWR